jgi:hypothetical protein
MANQINWGQAANDNEIGFGQGAFNSSNDWGKVYEFSPSGETDLKKKF